MMKRLHKYTFVGMIAGLIATPGILLTESYRWIPAVLSLVAYSFSMKEVSKYTSWFQFSVVLVSSLLLGFALEYPFTGFPIITLAILIAGFGSIVRIMFFRYFAYTGYIWAEPLFFIVSTGLYFAGNLQPGSHHWELWAFPAPVLLFFAIIVKGVIIDRKQLLNGTKGGYKIQIGKTAPDFSLPDEEGNFTALSSFIGKRHLLLIFVRGDWCPGCHMMLRTYQKQKEKFQEKNILAMAIGPDPVGVNREMVLKLGLDFKVLSDEGQKTAMVYGIQLSEYDHDFAEKYEEGIPLPASFLIDIDGVVRYVSRPDKVGEFLNPSLIFPVIESLDKR